MCYSLDFLLIVKLILIRLIRSTAGTQKTSEMTTIFMLARRTSICEGFRRPLVLLGLWQVVSSTKTQANTVFWLQFHWFTIYIHMYSYYLSYCSIFGLLYCLLHSLLVFILFVIFRILCLVVLSIVLLMALAIACSSRISASLVGVVTRPLCLL